jgi:hypothetical protein
MTHTHVTAATQFVERTESASLTVAFTDVSRRVLEIGELTSQHPKDSFSEKRHERHDRDRHQPVTNAKLGSEPGRSIYEKLVPSPTSDNGGTT